MTREEAIAELREDKALYESDICHAGDGTPDGRLLQAIDMAIEALSKPNYESDTEVRLAVTDRNKDKVVLWDAFGEVEYYPQGDMYCPNCGARLVPENEYLEPTQTHGRLIDADALLEAVGRIGLTCDGGVDINDLEGTIQEMADADRPHGEWYNRDSDGTWATVDFAYCSECKQPIIHKHASPLWYFCPNCGADMRGEKE